MVSPKSNFTQRLESDNRVNKKSVSSPLAASPKVRLDCNEDYESLLQRRSVPKLKKQISEYIRVNRGKLSNRRKLSCGLRRSQNTPAFNRKTENNLLLF